MFYISKALGRNRKEQKEKPIIISTWACESSYPQGTGKTESGKQVRETDRDWCSQE